MKHTIKELWDEQVRARPDDIAVIDPYRSLTFREMDELSCTVASVFPKKAPEPGARVRCAGIVMDHTAEMIAAILAVLKAGMAYVPAEPSFPVERIRFMMEESQIEFFITNPHYTSIFDSVSEVVVSVPLALKADACECIENADVSPEAPAYVLYTSGTTGNPKGVVATNANVVHYVEAFADEFHPGPGDRMLQYSVCSFDIFVEEVFTTLLSGATLVIPPAAAKDNIHRLLAFCNSEHITEISGFPYLLLEFNKIGRLPDSLRLLISGGDVLRGSYIDRLRGRGVMIYNTYGPSETTVCATYQRCDNIEPLPDGTFPLGHPVKDTRVEIIDGEICIYGAGVTLGYLSDNPESSNFVDCADGSRMYRSGDLGYRLPDGTIGFLHRKDTQVMIYGKRVECEEVENVLNCCKGVEKALVCAFTDNNMLSYLVAYIVGDPHIGFSLHEVKNEMAAHLASFMIPEFFVRMPSLPMTANGKPDRGRLPVVLKDSVL